MQKIHIYDSYKREKREFSPIVPEFVSMYVCGPTVYSDVHLGNCRTFVSFDIIYRYFLAKGFKVRYVRNITDVGHLVGDVDTGAESKVEARARLEQKEPMEIVQKYTNGFHDVMRLLGTLSPSIEPTATGHLIEQIEMVREILRNGYAYQVNGSVYFDTQKLLQTHDVYGQLSGKQQEELLEESRDNLKNQSEKRHPSDFALWVKASPKHLMRWNTEWSEGYPGWHIECSAMSTKYLGKTFDLHGGGMDLQFPHHENEIAQNIGACGCLPANYWMHANMMLLNGKKMSKSDGNNITPAELFQLGSPFTSKIYSPMVFKFLLLQTHYRSTLNLTDVGLQAAEQGYFRMMKAAESAQKLQSNNSNTGSEDAEVLAIIAAAEEAMADDFNTAMALSQLFALATKINAYENNQLNINDLSTEVLEKMKACLKLFLFDVFGLQNELSQTSDKAATVGKLVDLAIELRKEARARKDFAASDLIRNQLLEAGIQLKDGKTEVTWEYKQ
jgi:cysteinyl-tRNA synthetase